MKNEDKIVELLAESLKRQDQMAEILRDQTLKLSKQSDILTQQDAKLDTVVDVIKDLAEAVKHNTNVVEKVVSKFDMLNDHERRIAALERRKKS
ncbi:MAG: hypothetical protein AAGF85_04790 [Bacteroidota bacterium]